MKKCISLFIITMVIILSHAMLVSAVDVQETFNDLTVGATSWSRTVFGNYQTNEENGAVFSISDDGYIGNCLHITENDTTTYTLRSKLQASSLAAKNMYTFKLKIVNDVNATAQFRINANNAGLLYIQFGEIICQGGGRFAYDMDTWYSVIVEITSTQTNVTVKDDKGNQISGYRAGTYDHLRFTQSAAVKNAEFAIDEVGLIQEDEISTEPKVQTPEGVLISQDAKNVSRMPELNFCYEPFMNLVSDDIVVTVTDEKGNPVDSGIYSATTTNFETVNVKFTQMLEKDSPYTITLSGVKDMQGTDVSSYDFTFTTEFAHKLTLNDLNITSGDDAAIELTFDGTLGYPSTDVRIMSVIYDGEEMSYLDYRTGVIDADGRLTLSSYTLPDGKELSDLTILVFADSQQLIPVCEAIKCFE